MKPNLFVTILALGLASSAAAQDDVRGTTVTDGNYAYPTATQNIPAFPTAVGFGKYTTGGRGGHVVRVTNLLDDVDNPPEGSLRWAVNQYPGEPVTVVFDVSGWIYLKDVLEVKHKGGITIAGQTAPGEGITLYPRGISFNHASVKDDNGDPDLNVNAIVRNIRVRCGSRAWDGSMLDVENPEQSLGMENAYNVIIDHCTFGWSGEELCTNSSSFFQTFSYNIFHEGLYDAGHKKGSRGYGVCWGGGASTFTHNLLAHNLRRSPRFAASVDYDHLTYFEFVNNVNYNWCGTGLGSYGGDNKGTTARYNGYLANVMNNYWRTGPATHVIDAKNQTFTNLGGGTRSSYFHFSGNKMDRRDDFTNDNSLCVTVDDKVHLMDEVLVPTHFWPEYTFDIKAYTLIDENLQTADEALADVLANAGCIVRDEIEKRVIEETRTQTATYGGHWNNNGTYGIIDDPTDAEMVLNDDGTTTCSTALPSEQRPDGWDTDGDGMPDEWEKANGFDPADAADGNYINAEGYTALEKYLASLMGEEINGEFGSATSIRTEHAVKFDVTVDGSTINVTSEADVCELHVFDSMGCCRLTSGLQRGANTVDASQLGSGVYIVWVTDTKGYRNAKKVMINR